MPFFNMENVMAQNQNQKQRAPTCEREAKVFCHRGMTELDQIFIFLLYLLSTEMIKERLMCWE